MAQETAKERIYREAFEEIKRVCDTQDHVDNHLLRFFITKKMMEIENLPDTTDKLSVEKLQEHLLPYKKEMVQKIIDEKMQLVTADEFLKLHKESLTAIRENDKLQEQLNTAKKALTEIDRSRYGMQFRRDRNPNVARQALASIGGDDGNEDRG